MADTLVIGYGNTLRGDDGIGPAVANEIAAMKLPGVRVRVVHQLTPELAEEMAQFVRVIFVDAAVDVEGTAVVPLAPASSGTSFTHFVDPRGLLALSQMLYGRSPVAVLVPVGGVNFEYRDGLSPQGREKARIAVERVAALISGDRNA